MSERDNFGARLYRISQEEAIRVMDVHIASLDEGIAKTEAALAGQADPRTKWG